MSNNFIKRFVKFQENRNQESNIISESVKVINDRFIVGGIELKQSFINSYIKKVKDSTGQNLDNTFSKAEIAEQLIKYIIDRHGDVDEIPPSALLGGDEEMEEQVDEISMEEDDVIVDEEGIDEVEDETEEEILDEEEGDIDNIEDEFKDIEDEEESEEEVEEKTLSEEEDIEEEETEIGEDELPL